MDSAEIVQALLESSAYPGEPSTVEMEETHISWVFLAGSDVYKLKKSVDFGFVDYSTRARRRHMCRQEVELNQRLSTDVYRGVERVTWGREGVRIGGRGRVLDYVVHMRRLPHARMLRTLVQEHDVDRDDMQRLARRIAGFHLSAESGPEIDRFGRLAALRRNAEENFRQTEAFAGNIISGREYDAVRDTTRDFLANHRGLLRDRVGDGRIRDGHGDLRTDNIYFENGIQIIDCIEFNKRFRYADVAADLAFLAMDLDAHAAPDLADALVDAYRSASGDTLDGVLDYYRMYRAFTRAKVACLRAAGAQPATPQLAQAQREATRYGHLAFRYAQGDRAPRLILMSGLTGSGKSTLARALGEVLCARIVSSDEVRKQRAGMEAPERRNDAVNEGLYAQEISTQVYRRLLARAESLLQAGNTVILDATFRRRADREAVAALAGRLGARFLAVHCVTTPDIVRERIEKRAAEGTDWSDGRWDVYLEQERTFEPLTEIGETERVNVDTSPDIEAQIGQVISHLES